MSKTPYCDVAMIKKILNITATDRDDRVNLAAAAASDAIDLALGDRNFRVPSETAADEERLYTPERPRTLEVDDLIAIHELATDPTGRGSFDVIWEQDRDFMLEPANNLAKGRPFERVKIHPYTRYLLPRMPNAVRITGIFGWPITPTPIVEYATILAVKLYKRPDAAFGIATFGDVSMQVLRNDPDFDNLLHDLTRDTIVY